MSARLRLVALATLAAAGVVVPLATAHATGCRSDSETRNTWHRIPVPAPGAVVAADDFDACSLTAVSGKAVWTSSDGGDGWRRRGDLPATARAVLRHGLPTDVVLAVPASGGLFVSHDAGDSWAVATGLDGVDVQAVAADPADRTSVWIAGSHTAALAGRTAGVPTGSVFHSDDGGSSWSEDAGGLPIVPHVVARIGPPYRSVFADDTRAGGLWRRNDEGAFTQVYSSSVEDVAASRLAGGGSQLLVAGAAGVVVTRDGGDSFAKLTSSPTTAVAPEAQHFSAFMYVVHGRPLRSTDSGHTSRQVAAGLSGTCDATSLTSDSGDPSTFQLRCADGSTWDWRSDGSDLSDVDRVNGDNGALVPTLPPTQPMELLGRRSLPLGRGSSASIAFDGNDLYYARSTDRGVVHRVRASDGVRRPDVHLPGEHYGILSMTYDSEWHVLYYVDSDTVMHALDLRNGRVTRLFRAHLYTPNPPGDNSGFVPTGSLSYDSSLHQFLYINDQATQVGWYTRQGLRVRTCNVPQFEVGTEQVGTTTIAAIVASGDGQFYAESEDDATVYRFDSSCAVTASYSHLSFSEAPDENDAMACDAVTFGQPAVWMRDASAGFAYAYAMPGGYCALSTRTTVTAPSTVFTGSAGTVCGRVIRSGTGEAVRHVRLDLLVANRLIGRVHTDGNGRACAAYRPSPAEAGRRAQVSRTAQVKARQPVLAAFLGTTAFRPSSARGDLVAVDDGSPPPSVPLPHTVADATGPPPPGAAPPVVLAPPPPPAPPAPQLQPLPQAHPGAQPGAQGMSQMSAQGQVGLAAQPDVEAAAAAADTRDEFSARPVEPLPDLRVVLPAAVLLGVVTARRRRQSRVRPQRT